MPNIEAVGDQVIVQAIYQEKEGKIFIPDIAQKQNSAFYGIVKAVGSDNKLGIHCGEQIAFTRNEGFVIEHEGYEYLSLKPQHILGVFHE